MGKNLKGKECGKGICQRKDGLYCARFVCMHALRHTYATRAIESGIMIPCQKPYYNLKKCSKTKMVQ